MSRRLGIAGLQRGAQTRVMSGQTHRNAEVLCVNDCERADEFHINISFSKVRTQLADVSVGS